MKTEDFLHFAHSSNLPPQSEVEKYIEPLREELRYHNAQYYIHESPVISDFDYDQLFSLLKKWEDAYPELLSEDSPTQKLVNQVQDAFAEAKHYAPLRSLDNTYNENELEDFNIRVIKGLKEQGIVEKPEYITELKLDGLGIALVYENDRLVRGATRGNGLTGEDVTENVKTIASIPLKAPFSQHGFTKIEIRGEIIMSFEAFEALNARRAERGESLFANPRNAASGSMRQLDSRITRERRLDAFFYLINYSEGEGTITSQQEAYELLKKVGIKVNPFYEKHSTMSEVFDYCMRMEEKRDNLPYEIDGAVIKVNQMNMREALGETLHHPRYEIAYKFKAREAITKLNDITVQVGRTGVLTPVAELEPVNIGGVTVKRATLHNEEDLKRKDVRIGDTVVVKRAGDVIPEVIKPILEKRPEHAQSFLMPTECPSCSGPLGHLDLTPHDQLLKELVEKAKAGDIHAQIAGILYESKLPSMGLKLAYTVGKNYNSLEDFVAAEAKTISNIKGVGASKALEVTNYLMEENIGVTQALELIEMFTSHIIVPQTHCANMSCPAQVKGRLELFVGRHAMDIEGLGSKLISSFVDEGLVKNFADIYSLKNKIPELRSLLYVASKQEKIALKDAENLSLFGQESKNNEEQKLINKILKNIEASKNQPLHRLVVGLNIENVGRKTAKVIADSIDSIWDLVGKSPEELMELPDIGNITAKSIAEYLQNPKNIDLLKALEEAGVNVHSEKEKSLLENWEHAEKKFIFTGELHKMSRDEAGKLVEACGGKTVSSVSSKTDFCVVGDNPGSKYEKAQKLGVTILNEEDFFELFPPELVKSKISD